MSLFFQIIAFEVVDLFLFLKKILIWEISQEQFLWTESCPKLRKNI